MTPKIIFAGLLLTFPACANSNNGGHVVGNPLLSDSVSTKMKTETPPSCACASAKDPKVKAKCKCATDVSTETKTSTSTACKNGETCSK